MNPATLKRIFLDPSLYLLLLANIVVFWQLWHGEIQAADAYWAYWVQSMVMIIAWTFRLVDLGYTRPGSAADLGISISVTTFSGDTKDENDYTGVQGFLQFALGFFLLYIPFLLAIVGLPHWETLLWTTPGFAVAHASSFFFYRGTTGDGKGVMAEFGKRLIPMHLGIVFGALFVGVGMAWLLTLLKTGVDIATHIYEHHYA